MDGRVWFAALADDWGKSQTVSPPDRTPTVCPREGRWLLACWGQGGKRGARRLHLAPRAYIGTWKRKSPLVWTGTHPLGGGCHTFAHLGKLCVTLAVPHFHSYEIAKIIIFHLRESCKCTNDWSIIDVANTWGEKSKETHYGKSLFIVPTYAHRSMFGYKWLFCWIETKILLIIKPVFTSFQHGWLQVSPLEKRSSISKRHYLGLCAAVCHHWGAHCKVTARQDPFSWG